MYNLKKLNHSNLSINDVSIKTKIKTWHWHCHWNLISSKRARSPHLIMKNVNVHTPICWCGWPWRHEWRGKEQLPHCQPEPPSAWDSSLQGDKTHKHTDTKSSLSLKKKKKNINEGNERAPVALSGASALLPLWISWAAKLFSSNEVPFMTGASSSNGFTEASEDTVIYCKASQRAVLPSWSLSSRSSLTRWTDNTQD